MSHRGGGGGKGDRNANTGYDSDDDDGDELPELIAYVSDMRRSFSRQLDAQLDIIKQQQERIQQQCRLIDEQREYSDELAWQIRDLRDSIRRVKESMAGSNASQWTPAAAAPQPAPRRQLTVEQPAVRSRITIEEIIDSDDSEYIVPPSGNHNNPTPTTDDENIYEAIEDVIEVRNRRTIVATPPAPRSSYTVSEPMTTAAHNYSAANNIPSNSLPAAYDNSHHNGTAESHDRRARYALTRNRLTYRKSGLLASIPDETTAAMTDAIARLQVDLRRHERDSLDVEDGFESVLFRSKEQQSFRRNSQRGSSKVACSMVPNIEEEYLPDEMTAKTAKTTTAKGGTKAAGEGSGTASHAGGKVA